MSRTVLANVDGFTPIIDSLVDDVGIIAAAVFGRIWRYCQMENGTCHASLGTIADDLHLSVRTVIRHSDNLVSNGYLKDLTPDLRNAPHTYSDTGKAGISINVTGMPKSHSGYAKESQPGITKSHLKKESKRVSITDDKKPSSETIGLYPLANAIASVCKMSLEKNRGLIFAEAKRLKESPDEVMKHYGPGGWWYMNDWRGKKGQAPRPAQIRETWGSWGEVGQTSDRVLEFTA